MNQEAAILETENKEDNSTERRDEVERTLSVGPAAFVRANV